MQSRFFCVGTVVPWAEPGVGAVATQAHQDPSYGPLGLAMMRAGESASQALEELLASDPQPEVRQVVMVDAQGNVAVHTGGAPTGSRPIWWRMTVCGTPWGGLLRPRQAIWRRA